MVEIRAEGKAPDKLWRPDRAIAVSVRYFRSQIRLPASEDADF